MPLRKMLYDDERRLRERERERESKNRNGRRRERGVDLVQLRRRIRLEIFRCQKACSLEPTTFHTNSKFHQLHSTITLSPTTRFLACSCFIVPVNQRNPGQLVSTSSQNACFFVGFSSRFRPKTMYPKVKVGQEQHEEDHRIIEDNNLKALLSLSLRVSPPPVRNQKGVSHPSSAEVPKCYVPHAPIPRVPLSEDLEACNLTSDSSRFPGPEKDDHIDEDRVNIRASSIPPPRAVISSPDNDTMIGNKNRIKGSERLPASKNYTVLQNRHALCKVKSRNVTETSPNMKNPKEDADKSSNIYSSAQKRRPTKSASNQKTHPKKWEF